MGILVPSSMLDCVTGSEGSASRSKPRLVPIGPRNVRKIDCHLRIRRSRIILRILLRIRRGRKTIRILRACVYGLFCLYSDDRLETRAKAGYGPRNSEEFGTCSTGQWPNDRKAGAWVRIPENVAADIVGHENPWITYCLYSGGATMETKREAIAKLLYSN